MLQIIKSVDQTFVIAIVVYIFDKLSNKKIGFIERSFDESVTQHNSNIKYAEFSLKMEKDNRSSRYMVEAFDSYLKKFFENRKSYVVN